MTGRQVLACVVAIVLATAVLPPAAAVAVNRQRVSRAQREMAAIADHLRSHEAGTLRARAAADVLTGPGQMPRARTAHAEAWLRAPRTTLSTVTPGDDTRVDPWRNSYLVNVSGPTVWILSAGPNGVIETPLEGGPPGGDDLAVHVQ